MQATGPVYPVLVSAIAELAALADEDGSTSAVDGFAVIESPLLTTKKGIKEKLEHVGGGPGGPGA